MKTTGYSTSEITDAIFFFILGNAIFVVLAGVVSDTWGRKKSAVLFAGFALLFYSLFFTGSWLKSYPAQVMGLFAGMFVGSFWGSNDTFSSIMIGESTPTNLRASVITIQSLISIAMPLGSVVASAIAKAVNNDAYLGLVYFCYSIPGIILALLFLSFGVGETKGIDVSRVTGEEWSGKDKAEGATGK
jgi:MFS family permease